MPNACVVFGCKSGYSSQSHKVEKSDILAGWIIFVNCKN